MLIVRIAGTDYPIYNDHDARLLDISGSVKAAMDQARKTEKAEATLLRLSQAAQEGDAETVRRLTRQMERKRERNGRSD